MQFDERRILYMSFVPQEILNRLDSLTQSEADELPFGVVKCDDNGSVELYNSYESELGKVAVSEATGKNFFNEVAPCTNNKLFKGKFLKGISESNLNETFNYTFTYKLRPTNVSVHMLRDNNTKTNWLFIQRR
jgi:photoactive yellow protein